MAFVNRIVPVRVSESRAKITGSLGKALEELVRLGLGS
jgi:hypothetical protein